MRPGRIEDLTATLNRPFSGGIVPSELWGGPGRCARRLSSHGPMVSKGAGEGLS